MGGGEGEREREFFLALNKIVNCSQLHKATKKRSLFRETQMRSLSDPLCLLIMPKYLNKNYTFIV